MIMARMFAPLPDWAVLRVHGADAGTLLQGQLTQGVTDQSQSEARLGGYCSPQGRLLASFVQLRVAPDAWLLACSADLAEATAKRLRMFVLRAKCAVELSDLTVAGAVGDAQGLAPHAVLEQSGTWLARLHDGAAGTPRVLRIAPAGTPADAGDAHVWRWQEVQSGVARITAATSGQYVPQMLNFEAIGAVNFKKGCYPGQEVVARSQYRGAVKRRLALALARTPLAVGDALVNADGHEQASVVLAAPAPDAATQGTWAALVSGQRDAVGSAALATAGGKPVQWQPLPYPLIDPTA